MNAEPERFTIGDLIFNYNQDPDHNAIESPGYLPLTYRDLRKQVLYVIKSLNALGYHRNDRIAVIAPAGPETAVLVVSIMAGFTFFPLNPHYKKKEFESNFSQLKIKAVIIQNGCETEASEAAISDNIPIIQLIPLNNKAGIFLLEPAQEQKPRDAEFGKSSDISHIFLTSGTTAEAKIVPLLQRQSFLARPLQIKPLKITRTDRCLHIVPYYHGMGIGLPLLCVWLAGGTVICVKDFIPSDFFSLLESYRPTYYMAGPAHHQAILQELKKRSRYNLKNNSLRFILTGSASLPAKVCHELEALLGAPVVEHFASSETGTISINFPPKRGSVGIPVVEHLAIINGNGTYLGPYEQGDIVVKGETVFSGYENAPDENKAAFTDGWFRTGDTGYLDDDGYLFLTGRKKDQINKGGEKISPEEIDTLLRSHHGVSEAMAFPVYDPVLGEDIAAIVVPADEKITETELRMYLLDRLVPFKVPRRIYFVDKIPKNAAGKPLRHVGSERYSQR